MTVENPELEEGVKRINGQWLKVIERFGHKRVLVLVDKEWRRSTVKVGAVEKPKPPPKKYRPRKKK